MLAQADDAPIAKQQAHGGVAGDAAKAVAIVGSVTGEEILAAILKSQASDAEVGGNAANATTGVLRATQLRQ
ncbi:variable large family protein (plasmid) [Borrelia sp. RT5S]|nr:variable large family protein [Borrelia sp. RT5S]UGQ16604.1 variable large family protein [Borrelia sp. RT5S]